MIFYRDYSYDDIDRNRGMMAIFHEMEEEDNAYIYDYIKENHPDVFDGVSFEEVSVPFYSPLNDEEIEYVEFDEEQIREIIRTVERR